METFRILTFCNRNPKSEDFSCLPFTVKFWLNTVTDELFLRLPKGWAKIDFTYECLHEFKE